MHEDICSKDSQTDTDYQTTNILYTYADQWGGLICDMPTNEADLADC